MDWYKTIKRYYDKGLWTLDMVSTAVVCEKITEEEFFEITGKKYSSK